MHISIHINKKSACLGYLVLGIISIVGIILIGVNVIPSSSNVTEECLDLPILMYHGILKNPKKQKRFIVTESTFESDLKYLNDNGYNTIFMNDLVDYVYNDKKLPNKPIIITFDDGYYNNYLYAFPLLKKYKCKMVLSPIGICVDQYSENGDKNPNYAHVSWDDINEMIKSGYVEIQNHTYNMHKNSCGRNGCKKKRGETPAVYRGVLIEDVMKAQDEIIENTGTTPTTFTYPFGAVSNASVQILKEMGFRATLGCENKMNKIYKNNKDCLYGLRRYIRPGGISTKEYFENKIKLN